MKPHDLVCDCSTGKLSHTKLWANVGYLVMTIAFLRDAWLGGLDEYKLIAYGVIVAGAASVSKFLSLRFGQPRYSAPVVSPPGQEDA